MHAIPRRLGLLILLTALTSLAAGVQTVQGQDSGGSPKQVAWPLQASYQFGQYILFQANPGSETSTNQVSLYMQVQGERSTRVIPVEAIDAGGWEVNYDVQAHPIRAYSNIVFWLEAELNSGEKVTTQPNSLAYIDNRFEWQARTQGIFEVHWYEGDDAFAQLLLDAAQQGLENAQQILPLSPPERVQLYAYANGRHMREAIQLAGEDWVAAHTSPDMAVMVLSLPPSPEQRLEIERQIPHELMHILVYQRVTNAYTRLPMWLSEGLASIAELYPNPDYLAMINTAQVKDTMLPMESLCSAFPRDASGAYLAYAQATSFTRFLYRTYGSQGLDSLLQAYQDGLGCTRGVEVAFGASLAQIEREWLSDAFGENPVSGAVSNLTPWLVLSGAVLLAPLVVILLNAAGAARRSRRSQSAEGVEP
jgi:hypothetical protein